MKIYSSKDKSEVKKSGHGGRKPTKDRFVFELL